MNARERFNQWLNYEVDDETRAELLAIQDDPQEIEDRFSHTLQFGTAGLRGKLGAGSNRMNIYTVRLATQALADFLLANQKIGTVAIAYDSRNGSAEFAEEAASVLIANGFSVGVFQEITPTPLLSFAVRALRASAGIMITASHNPPEYNGYKVYREDGVQILADAAQAICDRMNSLHLDDVKTVAQPKTHPEWCDLGDKLYEDYYQAVAEIVGDAQASAELKVLFTPLHGTAARFVPELLTRYGFAVDTVAEQMVADGSFPTVKLPNPEDPKSFELAFSQGAGGKYDIILATDPDADRVGCAVWHKGEYRMLNGNQMGVLLTNYLLRRLREEERPRSVVIKTIVTTEMIRPIAAKYGVTLLDTLTGFKYIGDQIGRLERVGKRFVFGFEESYGYLAGTKVRDKDAVLTSLLIAQLAADCRAQGRTLIEELERLMAEFGFYQEDLKNYSFANADQATKAEEFISHLRRHGLTEIAGRKIAVIRDFLTGVQTDTRTGNTSKIELPQENVLQYETLDGDRITLRPSGTEPKMKLYIGVRAAQKVEAEAKKRALGKAFDSLVSEALQ